MVTRIGGYVITRIWHGITSLEDADEYLRRMRQFAIPDYKAIPGNAGAYALRRIEGDKAHFLMLTFWESQEAIVRYAGEDIEKAQYYDFDSGFLTELEPNVMHYETFGE